MGWHLFQVTYDLLSPLHIGYHKVGSVQRTRYYIPARNLWAAVTERLTRGGFHTDDAPEGDYVQIGQWVRDHVAFSYFFVQDGDALLYPHYMESGLCYGGLSVEEFERRFLSAHVTTALDAATTSAATGSLHEVEFIAPHDRDGRRVSMGGWVWLDDRAQEQFDEAGWRKWLGELQAGGERRYGFGRLRLMACEARAALPDGYAWGADGDRPVVTVSLNRPLLAHAALERVRARGMIEPLVGRETTRGDSAGFGRILTAGRVCWMPGSVVEQEEPFVLEAGGAWRRSGA